jgi:hypothetical protein
MQVPLALLLMLSLLAFMDSRSTGACGTWATLLLIWYALYQWSGLLALYWPRGSGGFALRRVDPQVASAELAQPLLTVLFVVGVAQLLSAASAAERR